MPTSLKNGAPNKRVLEHQTHVDKHGDLRIPAEPSDAAQEAKNWQEKFHRGILRGLRNISETRKTKV